VDTRSSLEIRALRYLAQREYSRRELQQKLAMHDRSSTPQTLSDLLDKLERDGFLSTQRAAEQIIRTRRSRFGGRRILHELKEKGIDEHLMGTILPTLKETELKAASAVWQKKFSRLPGTREERAQQMRFMLNRGFSMETIQQVLSHAYEENS
jgi:regulatory protein